MSETPENKSEDQQPKKAAQPADNRVFLPREWPQRLLGSLFILALIGAAAFVTVTVKESLVSKKFESLQQDFYDFTDRLGFTIDEIVIQGRKRTDKAALLKAIGYRARTIFLKLMFMPCKDVWRLCPGFGRRR